MLFTVRSLIFAIIQHFLTHSVYLCIWLSGRKRQKTESEKVHMLMIYKTFIFGILILLMYILTIRWLFQNGPYVCMLTYHVLYVLLEKNMLRLEFCLFVRWLCWYNIILKDRADFNVEVLWLRRCDFVDSTHLTLTVWEIDSNVFILV